MTCRAALMSLFVLAACGGNSLETGSEDELKGAKGSGSTAAPTYALKATDAHTAGTNPIWKTSYPISSTYEVQLATEVTGTLPGHHLASVFVFTPGGASFIRYDVSFATDVAANAGEQQAERTATGWRVWVSLPVAGTMISTSNLSGTWSAETWVDAATAASAKTTFGLY
jgi:hypothetical protein